MQHPDAKKCGPGLWRLNVSALKDEGFQKSIIDNFKFGFEDRSLSHLPLDKRWDIFKENVRTLSILHGKKKRHLQKKYLNDLLSIRENKLTVPQTYLNALNQLSDNQKSSLNFI